MLTTLDGNVYFKGEEIEDYRAAPQSIMPDGLADTMTTTEFLDLITYLASLKQ